MSKSRITIIDCGASRTALGVFDRTGERLECVHSAVERFPVRAGGDDHWLENTAVALRTLNTGRQWTGPVTLVLPAHLTLTKHVKAPPVDAAKRAKIIRFEAEQAIPYALAEVGWDWVISGRRAGEEDVMIVAAKNDILGQLCDATQAAGFAPRRILPSSLATLAAFRLVQPGHAQAALILNIGGRSTNLLQVEGDRFVARTLALGGDTVTQQLAGNQDCDAEEAERIKCSGPSSGLVAGAMESVTSRLAQEINRSVAHFGQQIGLANPARIFLTGEGARLAGFAEGLAVKLKLPIERLEMAKAVDGGTAAAQVSTDLIGAAAIELQTGQPALDLLPARLREHENRRRGQPWILAATVLAVAALVPPILYYRQVTDMARAKIAAMEEALAPLRARESRNRANLEKLEQLKARVTRLQAVYERRASWLQLFTGLQERLVRVEDVWLEKLQTIPGAADTPMKLAVSGRMLDKTNPLAKVSPETFTRVKELLAGIVDLPSVAAVEGERFDNSQPGILKFDFIVVIDPAHPL